MRVWISWGYIEKREEDTRVFAHEGALVRICDLQVSDVPPDMVPVWPRASARVRQQRKTENPRSRSLIRGRVSTQDVQQHPRMVERLPTIVPLRNADHLRRGATRVFQPADA